MKSTEIAERTRYLLSATQDTTGASIKSPNIKDALGIVQVAHAAGKQLREEKYGMRLKDKVAIITGAGGTIGSATARRFLREGARLILTDLSTGADACSSIVTEGGEAFFIEAEISRVSDTERIINFAYAHFGRIDILFNNAGNDLNKSLHEYVENDYDSVINVHLKGSFFCTRYVLPIMMKQRSGSIVNMASILGLSGFPLAANYCAAKGALVNFTRSVAVEYAPYNIRCNSVCPGIVETEMLKRGLETHRENVQKMIDHHPMGRVAQPDEVASAVTFLASDDASFITGVSLPVDGGYLAGKS